MGDKSGIEWTDATWNPVTGCDQVSPGCAHCYAKTLAEGRLKRHFPNGFEEVRLLYDRLDQPLRWKKPRRVFVNSMADLFHPDVPDEFICQVADVMRQAPQHQFQILTKRHVRLASFKNFVWPENACLGISVENQRWVERIDALRKVQSRTRFVSFEPLLGSIHANLSGIHWAIVGGESGSKARPCDPQWVRCLREQCKRQASRSSSSSGVSTTKLGTRSVRGVRAGF